jgi:hypothetical protein
VISEVLEELIFNSTSLVGAHFNLTEKEELVPDSLVRIPVLGLTRKPAVSQVELSGFAIGEGLEFPGGGKITCCFLLALGKRPRIALGHAMQLDTEKRIIIAIEIFLTKLKECPVRFFSIDYMTINLVNLFQKS